VSPVAVVLAVWAGSCGARESQNSGNGLSTTSASASVARGESKPDLPSLAREVEQRGLAALPGGSLERVFAAKGNIAVSPFGVGFTELAAEALSSPSPGSYRRYAALTNTAAACFGAVSIEHRIVFAKSVVVSHEANDVAWALSPGEHMGLGTDEPAGVAHCAATYSPLSSIGSEPSIRDLLPAAQIHPGLPALAGERLGRSLVVGHGWFSHCRDTEVTFRSCDEPPPSSPEENLSRLSDDEAPQGIEIQARARVEQAEGSTIIVLPIESAGLSEREQRHQSFAIVIPTHACEGPATFDAALSDRLRAAAKAPRDIDVSVVMPDIASTLELGAPAPAPLDGLLVSAKMFTTYCGSFPSSPLPAGTKRITLAHPFLYAIVDDDTGALLLVGRFSNIDRKKRPPPENSTRNEGGAAPIH